MRSCRAAPSGRRDGHQETRVVPRRMVEATGDPGYSRVADSLSGWDPDEAFDIGVSGLSTTRFLARPFSWEGLSPSVPLISSISPHAGRRASSAPA